MLKLPKAKYNMSKKTANKFILGGINHTEGAKDGEIYDCLNVTTDDYPALSVRNKRDKLKSLNEKPYGMGSDDKLYYCAVDDEDGKAYFYYDDEKFFEVEKSEKNFTVVNKYICVFPDRKYFSLWERESMGTYDTLTALQEETLADPTLKDGDIYTVGTKPPYSVFQFNSQGTWKKVKRTKSEVEDYAKQNRWIYLLDTYGDMGGKLYVEEDEDLNYIRFYADIDNELHQQVQIRESKARDINWMRIGDYFKVTLLVDPNKGEEKNQVYYTELIKKSTTTSDSKEYVTLTFDTKFSTTNIVSITIERAVPNFEFAFCSNNRLWGIDGDEIHASALGDPFNYNNYSTLSGSAWAVSVLSSGKFTGGIEYNGYPTFFKEDSVIRVGGNYTSQYSTYETKDIAGVMRGSEKSLAIVNGVLYYLSSQGVMGYSGSYPYMVGSVLGEKLQKGVGGTVEDKYYLAAKLLSGENVLYKYDTKIRAWVKESAGEIIDFARLGKDFYFMDDSGIYLVNGEIDDEEIESFITLAPIYDASLEEKGVSGISVSCKIEEGAHLKLLISYDGEDFIPLWEKEGKAKRNIFKIPVVIRRCGTYRLKFEGTGKYTIYAIGRERYYA